MLIGDNYPNLARAQYAQALSNLMRAIQLYPDSGAAYRDLGTVYAKYAQFAGEDHQTAKQKAYFQLARQESIKALQLNAPQDQTVYPRLVALDLQIFQNYCEAATYAQTGLQLVQNKTLPDANGQYAALFQQAISLARAHGCPSSGQ